MSFQKLFIGFALLGTLNLQASLGGGKESLFVQSQRLHVPIKKTQRLSYSLHEMKRGHLQLREFMTNHGKVFAVSWSGSKHPNLSQITGAHYEDFRSALEKAKKKHRGHGPLRIELNNFYLELGGSMRSVYGRMWLKNQIPQGVTQNEIR